MESFSNHFVCTLFRKNLSDAFMVCICAYLNKFFRRKGMIFCVKGFSYFVGIYLYQVAELIWLESRKFQKYLKEYVDHLVLLEEADVSSLIDFNHHVSDGKKLFFQKYDSQWKFSEIASLIPLQIATRMGMIKYEIESALG